MNNILIVLLLIQKQLAQEEEEEVASNQIIESTVEMTDNAFIDNFYNDTSLKLNLAPVV